jgi:apolipoprotein N-acyltransferase
LVNILLSIFSGALLSAAFAPFAIWWVAPIAIAVHMQSLKNSSRPFLNSFIFALSFNAIALHWTSTYVGATPWLILAVGQAALFIPLGLAKKYSITLYPLIFLILEQVRGSFPFEGFGWLRIAYSQADSPYRGIAAFGGAAGLSAMTLSISLVIFSILQKRLTLLPLFPLLLLLIPLHVQSIGAVKVLMVQGDVPELGLDFNARATQVFFNHVKESKKALATNSDIDFILWPENAVDVDPFTNQELSQTLDSFVQPLIVGAVIRQNNELQNASILWGRDEKKLYVKQHLTPFGEYIPLRALAEKISPFTDSVKDFSAGDISTIFSVGKAKIAPIICFELIDDEILHRAAISSNLVVVQTNSATFGRSAETAQQLAISRVRAIEHGRNILSVSTTGISAQIDYTGNILQSTQIHRPEHIFAEPELITSQTPRDRAGDWALVATLIWLLLLGRKRSQRYI